MSADKDCINKNLETYLDQIFKNEKDVAKYLNDNPDIDANDLKIIRDDCLEQLDGCFDEEHLKKTLLHNTRKAYLDDLPKYEYWENGEVHAITKVKYTMLKAIVFNCIIRDKHGLDFEVTKLSKWRSDCIVYKCGAFPSEAYFIGLIENDFIRANGRFFNKEELRYLIVHVKTLDYNNPTSPESIFFANICKLSFDSLTKIHLGLRTLYREKTGKKRKKFDPEFKDHMDAIHICSRDRDNLISYIVNEWYKHFKKLKV